jgi:hypothetical protein
VNALGLAKSVQKAMWDELWNAAFLYAGQRTAPIAWLQKIAAALQPALPARAYTRWLRQVSDTWPDITPSQRAPANSYEDQQQHSDTEAEVYIENAGLVLVHPFLPSLFESLHLLDPTGQLAQPERALLVLHYLATGRTRAEEHELTLPKILCGLSQAAPVDVRQVMSKAEKAKADKLLLAIISYWEALRNTTPDGLRGNFLYRTGKLSRREDNAWRLLVERKTHDILLNQLPWGIGMIKLPWMTGILQVDWN